MMTSKVTYHLIICKCGRSAPKVDGGSHARFDSPEEAREWFSGSHKSIGWKFPEEKRALCPDCEDD